jgi:hypothetical protein
MKTRIAKPESYLEYYERLDGSIIVQLGGMQISRRTLDSMKSSLRMTSDGDAIDTLVRVAEEGFRKAIEQYED